MPVGELRDDEGNLYHPGLSGMSYHQYRSWKQYMMRKAHEAEKARERQQW